MTAGLDMIVASDNKQLHNMIDPGQLWSPHDGTLLLPDKQSVPGASVVSVCLTSPLSVSCPPNPYQRHIKTLNVASFASAGMRLQDPHVLILIADSCMFVIYVPTTQQLPTYPTRQSTVNNRATSNQSGHSSLPKVPLRHQLPHVYKTIQGTYNMFTNYCSLLHLADNYIYLIHGSCCMTQFIHTYTLYS